MYVHVHVYRSILELPLHWYIHVYKNTACHLSYFQPHTKHYCIWLVMSVEVVYTLSLSLPHFPLSFPFSPSLSLTFLLPLLLSPLLMHFHTETTLKISSSQKIYKVNRTATVNPILSHCALCLHIISMIQSTVI